MPGRQALVLRKTSAAVSSLLVHRNLSDQVCDAADLSAGILFPRDSSDHLKDEVVVGVAAAVLCQLRLTSGSWVLVRNMQSNVTTPAKVIVLDPPSNFVPSQFSSFEHPFSSCSFSATSQSTFDPYVAYVSPLLAFSLGLHLTWLESLVTPKNVVGCPFGFDKKCSSSLRIQAPDLKNIKFASHVRISYVRIPVNRTSFPRNRQDQIDAALKVYFEGGRIMKTGTMFSVHLKPPSAEDFYHYFHFEGKDEDIVRFKVTSLEPSTEEFLWIDQEHTALVLSGSVPSQLPPLVLRNERPPWCSSLHAPLVCELISIIAPCVHSDMIALKISTLLLGPAGAGKRSVVRLVAEALGIHVVEYNCFELLGASEGKTTFLALENAFKIARRYSPSILLLRRFGAFGENWNPEQPQGSSRIPAALRSLIANYANYGDAEHFVEDGITETFEEAPVNGSPKKTATSVTLIAAAENEDSVKSLRHCFTHELSITTPDEAQRLELLQHYLGTDKYTHVSDSLLQGLKSIASQTAGLVPRDLSTVAADICAFALEENGVIEKRNIQDGIDTGLSISADALGKALELVKKRTASAIGTPKVPNVKWEDIGGLENVKRAILDTVQVPLLHRELFNSGLRQRSGVLLYGPPGTGKTLLAKAVATECSLNFLSVKGPELINMFIGESEKNVREIFEKARGARPCVVFFDELDALAPARGASGDSGGVMDRVVSQMLAEIDGLGDNSQDLFVIGATNRPDLIDSALLRPGRFDKLLYVGISPDPTYREKVLTALVRKFQLDEDVSLRVLARRCPENFTGADMYALCADAWMQAVKRKASAAHSETDDDATVTVKQEDFLNALAELKPSLSFKELAKYEQLRLQFQGSL